MNERKTIPAPEPQKTEKTKPKLSAGLCTTLGYIANRGPKLPPGTGE